MKLVVVSKEYILIYAKKDRGKYPASGHLLSWAISFFFNEKKINMFRLMHNALFIKVI